MENRTTVTISNKTIIRTLLWVVVAILAFRFIGRISHVLTLIFASFFLAMALSPIVDWASRRLHIKGRGRATLASYLLVVAVLTGFFILIVPPLINQTRDFIRDVPSTVNNFQQQDTALSRTSKKYNIDTKISEAATNFTKNYGNFGTTVIDTGKRLAEFLTSFVVVLVLTFMMLVEGPKWLELGFGVMPSKDRDRARRLAQKMHKAVKGFVNGQVILAGVAGLFCFGALEVASYVMDVQVNAMALAGIVAVFAIIPLFGTPLGALLVVLACMLSSVSLAIVMAIYFVVYSLIENHTFQPLLQAKLNELSPMMVFIAALIGVGFGGIFGAIIAIPAASAVKIMLEDYFVTHKKVN